jgi:hypothetical protein
MGLGCTALGFGGGGAGLCQTCGGMGQACCGSGLMRSCSGGLTCQLTGAGPRCQ